MSTTTGGRDGYTASKQGKVLIDEKTGSLVTNDVMQLIREQGNIDTNVTGRIVLMKR